MLSPQPAPTGAHCAVHQEQLADGVCPRCGNFLCALCTEGGASSLCPACRQAMGNFPFSRGDFDFSRVWGFAFERWRGELTTFGVCAFIFLLLGGVGSIVSNVITQPAAILLQKAGGSGSVATGVAVLVIGMMVGVLVNVVVQGIGQMGLMRVAIDVLHGRKPDINRMFSQTRKLKRYVGLQLAIFFGLAVPVVLILGAALGVGFLAAGASLSGSGVERAFSNPVTILALVAAFLVITVGAIYVMLPLTFAPWELVYGDTDPLEALRRAWRLGDGFRAETFGYALVVGLAAVGIMLAGLLAFCVGVVVALPIAIALQHAVMGGLYLSLRNGSDLPVPPEP
ncbi:MAG: hypothetical protein INH41_19285 [Myxococcaceae bacterium]|jgi:hypothetical protein|nr:hypothetical protein [Myxococcaceae bacterium]MCA3014531.1 hypothetical protein [Myxococcaceae bacterium]